MVWVATKDFSVAIDICWPSVATEIQCHDRVWGWAKLRSRQGSPCVTIGISGPMSGHWV